MFFQPCRSVQECLRSFSLGLCSVATTVAFSIALFRIFRSSRFRNRATSKADLSLLCLSLVAVSLCATHYSGVFQSTELLLASRTLTIFETIILCHCFANVLQVVADQKNRRVRLIGRGPLSKLSLRVSVLSAVAVLLIYISIVLFWQSKAEGAGSGAECQDPSWILLSLCWVIFSLSATALGIYFMRSLHKATPHAVGVIINLNEDAEDPPDRGQDVFVIGSEADSPMHPSVDAADAHFMQAAVNELEKDISYRGDANVTSFGGIYGASPGDVEMTFGGGTVYGAGRHSPANAPSEDTTSMRSYPEVLDIVDEHVESRSRAGPGIPLRVESMDTGEAEEVYSIPRGVTVRSAARDEELPAAGPPRRFQLEMKHAAAPSNPFDTDMSPSGGDTFEGIDIPRNWLDLTGSFGQPTGDRWLSGEEELWGSAGNVKWTQTTDFELQMPSVDEVASSSSADWVEFNELNRSGLSIFQRILLVLKFIKKKVSINSPKHQLWVLLLFELIAAVLCLVWDIVIINFGQERCQRFLTDIPWMELFLFLSSRLISLLVPHWTIFFVFYWNQKDSFEGPNSVEITL